MSTEPRTPGGGLMARLRSLCRGLFRRSEVESEMAEEFRHHIDLRTADLMREGLSPKEARRRAHVEFGHVETHREGARASRGLRPLDRIRFSWIDVKLGLRMLVKHPGLTLVAVFALGVGIPVGMAPMHLARAIESPLPEDREDRVRGIRFWDPATGFPANATYPDYESLRDDLTAFESIGAFRPSLQNVGSEDGRAAPVSGTAVTASTFDILGTPPLLGRTLTEADEIPGAPDVIVLGYDVWQARFGSDPNVVGRTVSVSGIPHTVVGVMPRGFLFPAWQQAWLPLRHASSEDGPNVLLFGRLAPGTSSDQAQAQLDAVGLRAREDLPEARAEIQPQLVPFGLLFMGIPRSGLEGMPEFYIFLVMAGVLLLVACGNVAMLVFARTATRFRELAVRTALGASRARIVSQMFAETLVLSVLAAGTGLFVIDQVLRRARLAVIVGETDVPYWLSLRVTPEAIVWAIALAALCATVAGVVPALRITGAKVQESIRNAEAGRSGIRFGGVTSALIVADVAVSVAAIAFAVGLSGRMMASATNAELTGIDAEEYLAAQVSLPVPQSPDGEIELAEWRERLATVHRTVVEQIQAEPGVRGVAVADALPRMDHPSRIVELEGAELPGPNGGIYARTATVDVDFFDALGQPILGGRGFDRGDLDTDAPPVIVNTVFVERFLSGVNPVGRSLRFANRAGEPQGPWHEIVGFVGHLGVNLVNPEGDHAVYVVAAPGSVYPMQLGIHLGAAPETFVPTLREIVQETDPNLILGDPVVLDTVYQGDWYLMLLVTAGFAFLVVILVTLAASGIYAMMSFSVSERTREIGIRTALGAKRTSLILTILRRSLAQIAMGAALGMPLGTWVFHELQQIGSDSNPPALSMAVGLGLASVIVGAIGLLSCVSPTRRALRIEPNEALRGAD